MTNKEKISAVFFGTEPWSLFNENDREWLMASANEGDLQAACLLINGMHYKYHCWTEKFVDEDTNEEIEVNRNEIMSDGTTFEPDEEAEARLRQMVFDAKEKLSDEELMWACRLIEQAPPLYLERIRRGEENAAFFIEDPVILQELCDKGNKTAFEEMGAKYDCGDEVNGIFIDPKKAKEYYGKAGCEYEYKPYEADFPCETDYIVRGSAEELEAVKTLVNELTNRYGTPGNELGLYVPMEILMQTLVGSKYYSGNLLSMDTDSSDCIVLRAEADSAEPLLYALRQAFPNLEVEIKDEEFLNENMAEKKHGSDSMYLDAEMDKKAVQDIANQMQGKGLTMDELMDAGMKGIARAKEHYDDVLKGCKPSSYKNPTIFYAYAVWWIRQAMRQAIEEREKERKS